MNFRPALYRGKPVLTWWEGKAPRGLGRGVCVIADASYREIARFRSGGQVPIDLHDFVLTRHGTALVTVNESATGDLTPLGGRPGAPVIGGAVQELAIPSGRVLWEWRSLDHVAVEESYLAKARPFDYFHINSVDFDRQGNLLVSARNTWTIYKVSRETGRVIWRLGGKRSDFRMGSGTVTAWQHDARFHDSGRAISLFDNGAAPQVSPQSRALIVGLDVKRMRAFLVRRYTHHPGRIVSPFMGSAQLLPNGNMLVGWGGKPWITEFASDGSIRFDAKLPPGGQNYRARRLPWVGRPSRPPVLVSHRAHGRRTLYASWNGATEVATWVLRAGARRGSLQTVRRTEREGFETAFDAPKGARYAAVVAHDGSGKPLGTSRTVRI
jgi:hypothetical protein